MDDAEALRLLLISAECELIVLYPGRNPARATWKFNSVGDSVKFVGGPTAVSFCSK